MRARRILAAGLAAVAVNLDFFIGPSPLKGTAEVVILL